MLPLPLPLPLPPSHTVSAGSRQARISKNFMSSFSLFQPMQQASLGQKEGEGELCPKPPTLHAGNLQSRDGWPRIKVLVGKCALSALRYAARHAPKTCVLSTLPCLTFSAPSSLSLSLVQLPIERAAISQRLHFTCIFAFKQLITLFFYREGGGGEVTQCVVKLFPLHFAWCLLVCNQVKLAITWQQFGLLAKQQTVMDSICALNSIFLLPVPTLSSSLNFTLHSSNCVGTRVGVGEVFFYFPVLCVCSKQFRVSIQADCRLKLIPNSVSLSLSTSSSFSLFLPLSPALALLLKLNQKQLVFAQPNIVNNPLILSYIYVYIPYTYIHCPKWQAVGGVAWHRSP